MSYSKEYYNEIVVDSLKKKFGYKNPMEVPVLKKVSLNMGLSANDSDGKFLDYVVSQLSAIAGQKAVLTRATKSIAGFKLRENMAIGCTVTLRGKKMYEFLDRLIYVALPRVRDFRGLPAKSFNQSSHYSFGLKEHNIFAEIDLDKISKAIGLNVNIVTSAKSDAECKYLLQELRLPIN